MLFSYSSSSATRSCCCCASTLPGRSRSQPRRRHCENRRRLTVSMRGEQYVKEWVADNLGFGEIISTQRSGGSGWAATFQADTESGTTIFVKVSETEPASMFAGEAEGLKALRATNSIAVPEVYAHGTLPDRDGLPALRGGFIVIEYLPLKGSPSQSEFGRLLAQMHLATPLAPEAQQGQFGFPVNNTIGATPQPNPWTDNWVDFFREHRLGHQLKLARDSTLNRLGDKLLPNLEYFFQGISVKPSTLHGDLWSGNISAVADGRPTIYDPAVYYGHHEADFGMSWCASFSNDFYRAYHELIPKEPGFESRRKLYLLYHYLNHYNLFGGGYYHDSESIMSQLAREVEGRK